MFLGLASAAPWTATAKTRPAPDITGVWRMARPSEVTDPRQAVPPIPSPPLNPRYRAIYDAQQALARAAEAEGRPIARDRELCIPDGMPKLLTTDLPLEILQTPGQVTLITEFMSQVRRIDMVRRRHPIGDDLEQTFYGDSIGRWEGGVLVVDTVGFKSRTFLFNEVPHSDALRIVERIRLRAPDILEDRITLHDPEVLTEPWTVIRVFVRRPDLKIGEFVCTENNLSYRDADGRLATRPQ